MKKNWTVLNALEHASFVNSVHASYRLIFSIVVFSLTLSDAIYPWFSLCFFLWFLLCLSFPFLSIMVRKTTAHRTTTSSSTPAFESDRFRSEKNQETYKKLNIFRSVWAERKVVLDELDLEIKRNFERKGWFCWILIILLRLPWLESSTRTSLSTPMIPILNM